MFSGIQSIKISVTQFENYKDTKNSNYTNYTNYIPIYSFNFYQTITHMTCHSYLLFPYFFIVGIRIIYSQCHIFDYQMSYVLSV